MRAVPYLMIISHAGARGVEERLTGRPQLKFHLIDHDAEFEVETIDKSGGFIGSLYLNKTENAAVALVREGLATVHSFSADSLSWARQLHDAEVRVTPYSGSSLR